MMQDDRLAQAIAKRRAINAAIREQHAAARKLELQRRRALRTAANPKHMPPAPTPWFSGRHPVTARYYKYRFLMLRRPAHARGDGTTASNYPLTYPGVYVQFHHTTEAPEVRGTTRLLRGNRRTLLPLVRIARTLLTYVEWDTTQDPVWDVEMQRWQFRSVRWQVRADGATTDPDAPTHTDPLARPVRADAAPTLTSLSTPLPSKLSLNALAQRTLDFMEAVVHTRGSVARDSAANPDYARRVRESEDAGMGQVLRDPTRGLRLDPWHASRRRQLTTLVQAVAAIRREADEILRATAPGRAPTGLLRDEAAQVNAWMRDVLATTQELTSWVQVQRTALARRVERGAGVTATPAEQGSFLDIE